MGTIFGGARRDRTADLLHAMQVLSQLSYSPAKIGNNDSRESKESRQGQPALG